MSEVELTSRFLLIKWYKKSNQREPVRNSAGSKKTLYIMSEEPQYIFSIFKVKVNFGIYIKFYEKTGDLFGAGWCWGYPASWTIAGDLGHAAGSKRPRKSWQVQEDGKTVRFGCWKYIYLLWKVKTSFCDFFCEFVFLYIFRYNSDDLYFYETKWHLEI